MKNATSHKLALAYYRMCSTDVYCSKQTGSSSTKAKPSPIISSFLNGQKKTVDAAKICGGAENVVKRNPANIRKWIARFYYLGIYTPLEARGYCLHTVDELPIDMGNSICTAH